MLICMAAIGSKLNKKDENENVLIILEVDYKNGFTVTENLENGQRRKSGMPLVTKIMYKDCGLVVGCFGGYIELYDSCDFTSKGKWDN